MARYLITETIEYVVEGDDEEHAEQVFLEAGPEAALSMSIRERTVDYDTEGADVGDTVSVPQDSGGVAEAYITDPAVDVNPARTAGLFALAS